MAPSELVAHLARSVHSWDIGHPCSDPQRLWPDDARRAVARTIWVSVKDNVACTAGYGPLDRARLTQQLILDGLLEASKTRRLPNFPAVRIGLADAHCNETSLAYATYGKGGRPCLARLIPSEHFGQDRRKHPSHQENFFRMTSGLATASATHVGTSRCGWAGSSQSDATRDPTLPPGLFNPVRQRFLALARNHSIFDLLDTSGAKPASRLSLRAQASLSPTGAPWAPGEWLLGRTMVIALVSFVQVERWRCLVDIRGLGYSGRVPYLLHSNRTLLYVERPGLLTHIESRDYRRPLQPVRLQYPSNSEQPDARHPSMRSLRRALGSRHLVAVGALRTSEKRSQRSRSSRGKQYMSMHPTHCRPGSPHVPSHKLYS